MSKVIPATALRLGMYIDKLGGSWLQHPFMRSSFLLTDKSDIKRIVDAGIKEVWIDETKGHAYSPETKASDADKETESAHNDASEQAVESDISSKQETGTKSQGGSIDVEIERAKKLCQSAKEQVKAMFRDARLGKSIDPEMTLPLVGQIEQAVERNTAAILSVARLKTHDDYTYMHSVAVCGLMLALAKELNLDDNMVQLAGVGGLMHDLGKAFMPLEILNKPGKLTDAEFAVMKKHPAAGAKLLHQGGAAQAVVDIALHHHEKINGSGYPQGLKGEDISILARMGAICDVYDAITSERAYKQAWDPAKTIKDMAHWEGHFDKDLFTAFVKCVGIYPVGSLVRLSSQRLAVVIEPGTESLIKPKVKVFFSLRLKEPVKLQTIDLAEPNCKETIEGPEDPEKWQFKSLESLWQ